MGFRSLSIALLGAVCASGSLFSQQDGAPAPPAETTPTQQTVEPSALPVFRATSDLVVLHVNVFDGRSDAVDDLPETAFQVFEEDAPQRISFFTGEDVPVAVGLIVDNSSSMITRQQMVMAGATAFVESSHPEDEVFTISFNEHVRHGLPPGMPFTNRHTMIAAGLARYGAGGRTALHDAVVEGLTHLQRATHQKRVLVVLTDGDDNASRHTKDAMLDAARRSDAIIYTVSTVDRRLAGAGAGVLRRLAEVSGGVAYFPGSEAAIVNSFRQIAGNIRRGYSIGYTPTDMVRDGKFRRVKVTVRAPGYKNLSVRVRDGYAAVDHDAAR
jgi:VWFA-related protein